MHYLSLEFVERILKENNLYGNGNCCIWSSGEGTIVNRLAETVEESGLIINIVDNNLVLIPFSQDVFSNIKVVIEKKVITPISNISKVIVGKNNTNVNLKEIATVEFDKKITQYLETNFYNNNNEIILTIYNLPGVFENKKLKENYVNFINAFPNEGLDNLTDKMIKRTGYKIVGTLIILGIIIFSVIEFLNGEYFIPIIMGTILLACIYTYVKNTFMK